MVSEPLDPTQIDPSVERWSDDLQEELVEVGMEQRQARAYRRAFELGLTRMLSVMATREEFFKVRDDLRQEIRDLRKELRAELRETVRDLREEIARLERRYWYMFGFVVASQAGIYSILAILLARSG